jgi:hypothetical protein
MEPHPRHPASHGVDREGVSEPGMSVKAATHYMTGKLVTLIVKQLIIRLTIENTNSTFSANATENTKTFLYKELSLNLLQKSENWTIYINHQLTEHSG